MKKSLWTVLVAFLMLLTVAGAVFAQDVLDNVKTYFGENGKEYKAIGIEVDKPHKTTNIELAEKYGVSVAEFEQDLSNKELRVNLRNWLDTNQIENSGVFTNEAGITSIQLTNRISPDQLVKVEEFKKQFTEEIKIKYMKYSEDELLKYKRKVFEYIEKQGLDVFGVGLNKKTNQITIDVKQESYNQNKDIIHEIIDEDLIDWNINPDNTVIATFTDVDAGKETIVTLNGESSYCTLGFNAETDTNDPILFTAGHCGNGGYYTVDNNSIGQMTHAQFGSGSDFDAGYIELTSRMIHK